MSILLTEKLASLLVLKREDETGGCRGTPGYITVVFLKTLGV